jgi:hypothetical protein
MENGHFRFAQNTGAARTASLKLDFLDKKSFFVFEVYRSFYLDVNEVTLDLFSNPRSIESTGAAFFDSQLVRPIRA